LSFRPSPSFEKYNGRACAVSISRSFLLFDERRTRDGVTQ
jgi:hypothetical protein